MNINIEHITINITIQPQEPVQEASAKLQQEKPEVLIRRGHRDTAHQDPTHLTPEEKLEVEATLYKQAAKLQHKLRIAERLRILFGDDVASSVMARCF